VSSFALLSLFSQKQHENKQSMVGCEPKISKKWRGGDEGFGLRDALCLELILNLTVVDVGLQSASSLWPLV